MNTRLATYSTENLLRENKKTKISGKLLKDCYKNKIPFDLEILDIFHPAFGSYTSPDELKEMGEKRVNIRFNNDRNVFVLTL